MKLMLNHNHEVDQIADQYAKKGRIQIQDFWDENSAERIYQCLNQETPFGLTLNEGKTVHQMSGNQVAALSPEETQNLMRGVYSRATRNFQFLYNHYPLLKAYTDGFHPNLFLHQVFEFINSAKFLGFARRISGLADIRWADGQATLFRSGHFLTAHTDEEKDEGRLAAYVLNFTPNWVRDWGGYLYFYDERGNVSDGFIPTFNALNMFTIPAPHSVGFVSPFATGSRFSITGWLRSDNPPPRVTKFQRDNIDMK